MKRIVKLSGKELTNYITESVRQALNEGHWNSEVYDRWKNLREMLGDDTMLSEIYNYMSGDEIEDFVEHIKRNYDLNESKRINEEVVKTYRGVPGSQFIWHGEWSDPEIIWKGKSLNYWDADEALWQSYKDDCIEKNEEATEQGFDAWLAEQGIGYIESTLDDLVWADEGCQ